MTNRNNVDGSKRVKNIAAVLYLLALTFVVGGSYINQQQSNTASLQEPNKIGLVQ